MIWVRIKEKSWLARLAAKRLQSNTMAIVIGKTIHLHNTSRQEFLKNKKWVNHELAHVRQYQRLGYIRFLVRYLLDSVQNGYYYNRFELEAREMENDDSVTAGISFC